MNAVDQLAVMQSGTPDPIAAAEQLTVLFDLPSVGLRVTGARRFGSGSGASVEIDVSSVDGRGSGETLSFETTRDMASPAVLSAELVACTGAIPKMTRAQALKAVALTRTLAEHQTTASANDVASEWGLTFLQAADTLDVDLNDQAARWSAFSRLGEIEPYTIARENGRSIASACIVLRHSDGTKFVRAGWFQSHVRTLEVGVGQQQIAQRMARVGWTRRGSTGRIKATPPGRHGQLAWSFFLVPATWEEAQR